MVVGAVAFCALVYLGPIVSLLGWAFREQTGWSLAQLWRVMGDDAYHLAFLTTFQIAVVSTVICAVIGYPYAYLMATSSPRVAALLTAAVSCPSGRACWLEASPG